MSEQEKRQRRSAIGYIWQSSASNVGTGKDGSVRQRRAIQTYANKAGYKIVEWFSDLDVSGTDPIDTRPGFSAYRHQSRPHDHCRDGQSVRP
jgi:DNA invertase Pin-like site-specific DNA recombinase